MNKWPDEINNQIHVIERIEYKTHVMSDEKEV